MAAMRRYSAAPGWLCPSAWVAEWAASLMTGSSLLLDQIDQGEDRDPHDVDEVPVEPGDLHVEAVSGRQLAHERHHVQAREPDHAHRHVRAVEAGEHEERRAEQVLL